MARLYGLVVGVNQYRDLQIHELQWAAADAKGLHDALSAPTAQLGPDLPTIHCLQDHMATRAKILESLDWIIDRAGPGDTVIFSFSGHGRCDGQSWLTTAPPSDVTFLVPHDAKAGNLADTGIDFRTLSDRINRLASRRNLVLLDCCYSGAAGGRTFALPGERSSPPAVNPAFLDVISGFGTSVFTACSADEIAYESDELRHGIFSSALIDGLRGSADMIQDGKVDVDELWFYVRKETIERSKRKQSPVRTGHVEGPPIFLVRVPPDEVGEAERRRLERQLETAFKLRKAVVARSASSADLASAAAAHVVTRLQSHQSIAVTCGRTIASTILAMPPTDLSRLTIYPLNGHPTEKVDLTNSLVLSVVLWSKLGTGASEAQMIPVGIPDDVFRSCSDALRRAAERVFDEATAASVYLVGIGAVGPENEGVLYFLTKAGLGQTALTAMGAVGEINFQPYDSQGRFLALRDNLPDTNKQQLARYQSQFFAADAAKLLRISKRPGADTIGVASGDGKREAVLAAIRGELVRTMITDARMASWLLRQSESASSAS